MIAKSLWSFRPLLAAICLMSVYAFAAIPTIKITTKNSQEPTSTTECANSGGFFGGGCWDMTTSYKVFTYVEITNFELTGADRYNLTRTAQPDSIRLRGNSTADAAKKPFRIKFDKKTSLFGKEAAKSWVLLANFYDATFALNEIAFKLGQKMGLDYTPTSQMVDLYLNNKYIGIYQLTEQIQVNPGRVDIDKDNGWLVEFDYHAAAPDENHFTTSRYNFGTFIKSPEDLPNQSGYQFVKDDINGLCDAMYSNNFPENGYRDRIDLESFAKYTLIQLFMDNFDFNSKTQTGGLPGSNFAHKNVGGKITAGPLWDFDLAAGVTTNNFPAHYSTATDQITPRHDFYKRIFADPVFLAKWKKTWDNYKSYIKDNIPTFIDSIAKALEDRVEDNFRSYTVTQGGMNPTGGLNKTTYNTEVGKLKTWWSSRYNSFEQQINNMNIDTSKDIESQPSSSSRVSSSSSNRSSSSSNRSSSSSNRSSSSLSSSSRGTTPIILEPIKVHEFGMFITGKTVNVYAQEPSNVKLSVFDLKGHLLFSESAGTGSNFGWNLEHLGLGKQMLIISAEVKGQSGKSYAYRRISPQLK